MSDDMMIISKKSWILKLSKKEKTHQPSKPSSPCIAAEKMHGLIDTTPMQPLFYVIS